MRVSGAEVRLGQHLDLRVLLLEVSLDLFEESQGLARKINTRLCPFCFQASRGCCRKNPTLNWLSALCGKPGLGHWVGGKGALGGDARTPQPRRINPALPQVFG